MRAARGAKGSGVPVMISRCAILYALLLSASPLLPAIADPMPVQIAQGTSELDYWNGIKDSRKAEDYQAYLDKYPDGNFADLAKLRVKKYAPAPSAPSPTPAPSAGTVDPQQADIAYWNGIKASKNAADYQAYLDKYPGGEFVDLAKLRVEQYGAPASAAPAEQPAAAVPAEPKAAEPNAAEPKSAEPASAAPTSSPTPGPALTFETKDATVYAKSGGQVRAEPNAK